MFEAPDFPCGLDRVGIVCSAIIVILGADLSPRPSLTVGQSDQTGHSLNPNLMGVGWLRTHIRVLPMSALFLPIDFGPSFPRAGAIFDGRAAEHPAMLSANSIRTGKTSIEASGS
jgi:hypothetical protein